MKGEKNGNQKCANRINYARPGRPRNHDLFYSGIGGYSLDGYDKESKLRVFSVKSFEAISKILETVGVDKWEDLPGKYIRIKDNGWGSTVDEIGNLMEEKWFNIREFFKES